MAVDHRDILKKYIKLIVQEEGISFINNHRVGRNRDGTIYSSSWHDYYGFTYDQWAELKRCGVEVDEEGKA